MQLDFHFTAVLFWEYMCDTGLCAYLTRWMTVGTLMEGAMAGRIFENYAVMEMLKNYAYAPMSAIMTFYRDDKANEVDVFVEENGKIHPLEIKLSASPDRKALKRFAALEKCSVPMGEGGIICLAPRPMPIDGMHCYIPANVI